jgi:aspartate/methionine/tyrosine aminotransferase
VGAPHPLQVAAVTALKLPPAYDVRLREKDQAKRDLLLAYLEKAGFVVYKPRGAYYILTEVGHLLRRHGVADDTAFAMFLIREVGVATVPGSSFYAHPELGRSKIRFCFPKTDDVLRDAGERLLKLPS